jgi:glycosyltransferase involved in cell wall biosynthesis
MAGEVRALYRVPEGRIGIVPLGIAGGRGAVAAGSTGLAVELGGDSDGADAERLAEIGVARPYLLSLGTVLERRRPHLALEVLAALRADGPDLSLVLAGANRLRRPAELGRWIAELGLGSAVRLLGYVPESAVRPLYRGAELTLYLSDYEGFGLPPLESLACGTPAVVGPGLALDELWPDYPYRCPSLEPAAVVPMARRALAGGGERERVGEEGRARMGEVTWRRAAESLLAELEKAGRGAC